MTGQTASGEPLICSINRALTVWICKLLSVEVCCKFIALLMLLGIVPQFASMKPMFFLLSSHSACVHGNLLVLQEHLNPKVCRCGMLFVTEEHSVSLIIQPNWWTQNFHSLAHLLLNTISIVNTISLHELDECGETLLMKSVVTGCNAITNLLIDGGVNVNSLALRNYLALHHAVWEGNSELIRLLLDNGTHVDKRNGVTETLLALAALWEHNDILELLIRHRCRIHNYSMGTRQ